MEQEAQLYSSNLIRQDKSSLSKLHGTPPGHLNILATPEDLTLGELVVLAVMYETPRATYATSKYKKRCKTVPCVVAKRFELTVDTIDTMEQSMKDNTDYINNPQKYSISRFINIPTTVFDPNNPTCDSPSDYPKGNPSCNL